MYEESGVMTPCLQRFPLRFDELWCSQKLNDSWGIPCSFMQTATISDYNLGGAGDLFKAAEPVLEEPPMFLDPMTAAISMISGGDDSIIPKPLGVSDIESSINNGQLLMNDVFYECEKDLIAKEVTEGPFSEIHCIGFLTVETSQNLISDEKLLAAVPLQNCVGSSCLKSMKCVEEATPIPHFLDYPVEDFGAVCGIQGAVCGIQGDVVTIGNGNIAFAQSPLGIANTQISEDREEKLSRYRNKKSKRNFGRKIKYACRKALADGQPRIRGRFAKTEDINCSNITSNDGPTDCSYLSDSGKTYLIS